METNRTKRYRAERYSTWNSFDWLMLSEVTSEKTEKVIVECRKRHERIPSVGWLIGENQGVTQTFTMTMMIKVMNQSQLTMVSRNEHSDLYFDMT